MFKQFCWLAMLTLGVERAAAFSFLGPFESYQVTELAYRSFGDLGGPHNLGDDYRRNTPVLYYTFDQTFLDYFGSNGVAAVEEAFAVLNNLTNVSYYASDLSEFPLEAQSFNYRAQALNLTDLKSIFLMAMMEELGLGQAERFVWCLHDREVGPGGCPANVSYFVIKRNFDPVTSMLDQLQPSSYVNGTLYSYFIDEVCSGRPWLADAVEFPVDPSANTFTSLASFGLQVGGYFTGLTRDDVGGLRYLYRTNNLNIEGAGAGTFTIVTNFDVSQLLFTSNLTLLVNQALTNDAGALQALYPNLQIGSTTQIFTNVVTTNVFSYFTNFPWNPAGSVTLAFQTNRTTNVVTWYSHTFGNLITNTYYTNGWVTQLITNISTTACGPYAPPTSGVCTNVSLKTVFTNFINGDYYILPTNSDCGVFLVNTQLTYVLASTNDAVVATNATGTVNNNGSQYSESLIFFATNRAFVVHPAPCVTNHVERRQGIEHVHFARYDGGYDTLLDVYSYPITNQYSLVSVPLTNSRPTSRIVLRTVNRPDIIITAMDLTTEQNVPVRGGGSASITGFGFDAYARNLPFVSFALPGNYGPGTIAPNLELDFNKVGPLFLNFTPFNLEELTQVPLFNWGSFDGSTNAPVIYPTGTSIASFESGVFIQVDPPFLPQGFVTTTIEHTNYYQAEISVASYTSSFTPPVTWSLVPGTPGLPPGLMISSNGPTSARISGVPTQAGVFDFTVRLTDSQSQPRTTDRSYFIKVSP